MANRTMFVVMALMLAAIAIAAMLIMPKLVGNEASGLPEGFDGMGREQQVMVCAGCHQQQHANEMAGPHANAYKNLTGHIEESNGAEYPHRFYTDFLNKVGERECMACHATENLFGNWFTSTDEMDGMGVASADGSMRFPKARADRASQITGVDCLTCHYDGKHVVAGKDFMPTPGMDPLLSCTPRASALLSSDKSCLPCHASNMADMDNIYFRGADDGQTCISCHGEFDSEGRSTHYTYWRHDPTDKPVNERLSRFYEPLSVHLKGGNAIVRWKNDHMPHRIGECPEMVIDMRVTDTSGHSFGTGELRFNLKNLHDDNMLGAFDGKMFPGLNGISPVIGETDTLIEIALEGKWDISTLRLEVSGLSKPQYWTHDSVGVVRHKSTIPLK
ncbi:MAG: cytochrome c family protein [Flavobacteriales bacterium]|nr:cytochrome c family protein [Flavobacteriales bacterium]